MSKKIKLVGFIIAFVMIAKTLYLAEYSKRFFAGTQNKSPVHVGFVLYATNMALFFLQAGFIALLIKAFFQTIKVRKSLGASLTS